MKVSFKNIQIGAKYSRPTLARLWKCSGYQALARGVVTPKLENKIILFVTKEKQERLEQYEDDLVADILYWEGPTDHFAEDRILNVKYTNDEIHVFYRERHHSDFTYEGMFSLIDSEPSSEKPSKFTFRKNQSE
jgi:putative restriction endonuclease